MLNEENQPVDESGFVSAVAAAAAPSAASDGVALASEPGSDVIAAPARRVSRRRATTPDTDPSASAAESATVTAEARPSRRVSRRAAAATTADGPTSDDTADSEASPATPTAASRRRARRTTDQTTEVGAEQRDPDQPSLDLALNLDTPAPARRTRRTSTRAAKASAEVATADPTDLAAAATPADPSSEATAPEPAPAPSRARRSRRTAAESPTITDPVTNDSETGPAPDPDPIEAAEIPSTGWPAAWPALNTADLASEIDSADTAPAPHSPASPEPTTRRRVRGRRGSAAEAEPPEETGLSDGASDPIATALTELSQNRRRTPQQRSTTTVESLNDLASAIAGESESVAGLGEAEASDSEESDDGTGESRRRRRRRGGRRHRRGAEDEVAEAGDESEASDEVEDEATADSDVRRRRRRRRRRGEDVAEADDDPTEVVDRVRDPRSAAASSEVTGIAGSTRLEAKRQRRREGRAASRRRAPILSEAEFLARRESVARSMVIRQFEEYSQIAVLEDNILVEHYVDRAAATSLIGNVYLGRVQNILPSMEAVFFDIGRGRNAVLFAGEVDWDNFGAQGQNRRVEEVFTSGQSVLVQVTKDPIGAKGARLTSHISIPGRYVVYAPGGHLSGISRKLADTERNRLKSILDDLVGDAASVIVRTAAEGASTEELIHDINRLKAQWEVIERKAGKSSAPELLYTEPDLTMRIVRDLFTEDFGELVVDGNGSLTDAYDTVQAYVQHVAPQLAERVKRWDHSQGDLFAGYRIDEQIAKALDRKVHLPSGGTLIIDRTEAMTVIDVNTGKFTGSGGTLEGTVTSNNLEAAEEIVRQLRLRDIGGIIVIDFIDMVLPINRELLLRRLVECLSRDRTRHQVSEVTSLGLVQMTRKRVGTGLAEAFTRPCEHCAGLGYQRVNEPIDDQTAPDGGERQHRRGSRNN
jgi:ribonuclease E